ncbi:MAG: glycosyltransferase family 2 protein [Deltaproteobacteria bacterium]|nr:glycosyltransferase family 2 protein [Deltaproteobacteria bacterium]
MTTPRLSISIPTYNFGKFIGETLDSILPQVDEEVEVLVVDGASTDDTEEVVRKRQERYPLLEYHRLPRKGGIDRDMAKAVELARGDYVWLFSADDWMAKGALNRVLEEIRLGMDLYLCGFTLCDFGMRPRMAHPILDAPDGSVYDLGNPGDRKAFFERGLTTTAFFSFMSSLVIRKEKWDSAEVDDAFVGSCWDHVARLFRLIPAGLKVRYLSGSYLLKRDDNDSFSGGGIARRVGIAIDGYHRLAENFFGERSAEAFHIRRVLRNEYPLRNLLFIKLKTHEEGKPEGMPLLARLVEKLYRDDILLDKARILLFKAAPPLLLAPAEKVYKSIRALCSR